MSCTAYIVYTFHLTLHHANFGQFKAKQVLSKRVLEQSVLTFSHYQKSNVPDGPGDCGAVVAGGVHAEGPRGGRLATGAVAVVARKT